MAGNALLKQSPQENPAVASKNIPVQKLSELQISAALKGHYTPADNDGGTISPHALQELLLKLPALSTEEHVDPVLAQIQKYHPGTKLNANDHALIAYVDDCMTEILRQTDLDFRIEAFIRDLAPLVVIEAQSKGVKSIMNDLPILTLMDLLIEQGIGWSEDLGILGLQFMEKIENSVRSMVTTRTTLEQCFDELTGMFEKENPVFEKMEHKLCESALDEIAGQNARHFAAQLLNEKMATRKLPLFIIFMLQGSWYEFLQQIYNIKGPESKSWQAATQLTDLLIWSLQATTENEIRQREVISKLPRQIEAFCERMPFDTRPLEACLADIEAEYEAILAGEPSDTCDFELMSTDVSHSENQSALDEETLQNIKNIPRGQWFLYDDKNEPEEKVARIRVILNRSDAERMLYTNHNRRKVLKMTYTEMAHYLDSGTMRELTLKSKCCDVVKSFLDSIIQGVHGQKKKEVETVAREEKKNLIREYLAKRKQAIVKRLQQQRELAKKKRKRAKILRQKAQQKLDAATLAVKSLRVEAWVNLPVMEGTLTPCKLVAIIPGTDTYIFTNRAGLKVGEFSTSQLIHMIIAENSEILDTGAEFESVLASVVTGLREDKSKSYEELSGETDSPVR